MSRNRLTEEQRDIARRAGDAVLQRAYETNINIERCAEEISISKPQVYRWFHGASIPSAAAIARMLDKGYDINYILAGRKSGRMYCFMHSEGCEICHGTPMHDTSEEATRVIQRWGLT